MELMARPAGRAALPFLPFFAEGKVIKGFGRGSRSLGIPTANFNQNVVQSIPPAMGSGVYYGLANIDGGPVSKMVMSVGWNPHFNNQVKTMETHILRQFDADFYGSWMRVAVLGFIRTMESYPSLDELISAIHRDIAVAEKELEEPEVQELYRHPFFSAALPGMSPIQPHTDTSLRPLSNHIQNGPAISPSSSHLAHDVQKGHQ
ncbi:putative riboflavin kinase [Hypsibius exemplaris]|uniref:riboflavin kinase n=1 Tax=Hypsibius exemplaris TaxID=2072580 RepID=A0A1W0WF94_HYPEX|nr:putative riboflavin kinase [Hypsibius exemplaris]